MIVCSRPGRTQENPIYPPRRSSSVSRELINTSQTQSMLVQNQSQYYSRNNLTKISNNGFGPKHIDHRSNFNANLAYIGQQLQFNQSNGVPINQNMNINNVVRFNKQSQLSSQQQRIFGVKVLPSQVIPTTTTASNNSFIHSSQSNFGSQIPVPSGRSNFVRQLSCEPNFNSYSNQQHLVKNSSNHLMQFYPSDESNRNWNCHRNISNSTSPSVLAFHYQHQQPPVSNYGSKQRMLVQGQMIETDKSTNSNLQEDGVTSKFWICYIFKLV